MKIILLFIIINIIFINNCEAKLLVRASKTNTALPNTNLSAKGLTTTDLKKANLKTSSFIAKVYFGILGKNASQNISTIQINNEVLSTANLKPGLLGKPLNYPNPFKAASGTEIGYTLTLDMDMQIRIYDIFGHEIALIDCPSGTFGGLMGYNKVKVDPFLFDQYILSSGAYFYLIIYEGKVLGKGKMGILP